ncbi:heavy-metal-associated domain-containing protein [Bradyrhizobium betae]|uniref:Mercuric transport protein periplasmic component n=1 Tax=Bradyrhizobium betae TaxID=244734 RepID=A0A5P6NZ66_9BRAD|nr:cation transporter [Bradyrhizobium betae]MCS3725360.1 copper chaperone CopZ [Bradyrhizobium betae]QFI71332.1 mercuric transport protein periplasmic component [Bradyrhizobium betae]
MDASRSGTASVAPTTAENEGGGQKRQRLVAAGSILGALHIRVDNMYCAACPHIVKSSMAAVPGVSTVTVSFTAKTATVTFDDAKATTDTIAAASMNAGYPAQAKQ